MAKQREACASPWARDNRVAEARAPLQGLQVETTRVRFYCYTVGFGFGIQDKVSLSRSRQVPSCTDAQLYNIQTKQE